MKRLGKSGEGKKRLGSRERSESEHELEYRSKSIRLRFPPLSEVSAHLNSPLRLLSWLASTGTSSVNTRALLYGFRSVCSASDLLAACKVIFDEDDKGKKDESEGHSVLGLLDESCIVQLRQACLSVLLQWPGLCFSDFESNPELKAQVVDLVTGAPGGVDQQELARFKLTFIRRASSSPLEIPPAPPSLGLNDIQLMNLVISGSAASEIAIACTYWDSRMFLRLTPTEMSSGPFVELFNRISFGVASCILWSNNATEQAVMMSKLIEVAAICYDQFNFNTCAAMVSGLLSHDVSRLHAIQISARHRRTLQQLESLMSMTDNYSCLRKVERWAFEQKKPMIPFIPMHLRDLVTVSENKAAAGGISDNVKNALRNGVVIGTLLDFQQFVTETEKPQHAVLLDRVYHWPHAGEQERADKSDAWKAQSMKPLQPSNTNSAVSLLGDKGALLNVSPGGGDAVKSDISLVMSSSNLFSSMSEDNDGDTEPSVDDESSEHAGPIVAEAALAALPNSVVVRSKGNKFTMNPLPETLIGLWESSAGKRRLATKRLGKLCDYYVENPTVTKDPAVFEMIKNGVLFLDRDVLHSLPGKRQVLFMQPALFFPAKHRTRDVIRSLYYMGQLMFQSAIQHGDASNGYVFLADLGNWKMENFSVDYARRWFFAMQNLPIKIHAFVVVSAPDFFSRIFAILSKFMTADFRSRWWFAKPHELQKAFSAVPSCFGGDLNINYEEYANNIPDVPMSFFNDNNLENL